ncbi:potassium channel family protein [Halobium salinum]|uniref:Potassium channel family protein n=1 Tax=Halobium salinum TaxID=1364940 RepID=A0ABD5P7H8_9EURY|nr:NAD-binding protein [Halobium salinum]
MSDTTRRAGLYVALALGVMLAYAFVYQWALATFAGESISYIMALHLVVETFTTTGYGEQTQFWDHPALFLLNIVMMLTGVVLIFLTLPLFIVPLVEETLATDPPEAVDMADHVIVCTFTPRGSALVAELDAMDRSYVVVEKDRERARELYEDGYSVVHGDPETIETLENASVGDAVALVADDTDERNASIVLAAKECASDLHVVSLIEDADVADYHTYAGADKVVSPRRLLGERLAGKATTAVASSLGDAVEIGDDFEIAEMLVHRGSPLIGTTIADSGIAEMVGANVIGAWFRGEFVSPPDPGDTIDEHTILLVSGREAQLDRLKELTLSETRRRRRGRVVVAGYGEVGETAADALSTADVPVVGVDWQEKAGVDVVGDVTDRETLEEAGVDRARSIIVALADDTTTIFTTLVVKQLAPDVEVIARANEPESVAKLYRAGAEYVLALATVSGRMLASSLLDEEVITPDAQVEVVRTEAPNLVGRSLAEADVRARTNCTVIAVERDDELLTEVGPDFVVREGDSLIVAGTDGDMNRFNELAG